FMVSGRDILDDSEFHDRMNARVADRTRLASKKEAFEALTRTSERARSFVLALTDEELERPARHGIAEREMTAGQFMANFGRHVRAHTEQFRAGLLRPRLYARSSLCAVSSLIGITATGRSEMSK